MRKRIAVVSCRHASEQVHEWMDEPQTLESAPEYVANHSACSCPLGIARGLSHWLDVDARMWIDGPVDADVALFSEWNFFEHIYRSELWDFKKPSVLYLHSESPGRMFDGNQLRDMMSGICFTRPEALRAFESKWGAGNYWVAPWAVPDWWTFPPMKRSPYEHGTRNAIYAGRLERGSWLINRIISVAERFPDLHVWVISDCADSADHVRMDEVPNVHMLGGMTHGTFLNYIYYADVALDSGIVPSRRANNCKIWDYLAAGTPVVIDGNTGGDELITETGCGVMVEHGNMGAYMAAVQGILESKHTLKQQTIAHMKSNHTWLATVQQWAGDFKAATMGEE